MKESSRRCSVATTGSLFACCTGPDEHPAAHAVVNGAWPHAVLRAPLAPP